jgi:hypothetical protein
MAEVSYRQYDVNPTMRFVDAEGRLTQKGFELMKAVAALVSAVTIQDGEITTEMLEAEIIRVSTLFADEVVITSKVAQNAISELSALVQPGPFGPNGSTLVTGVVPIDSTNNTGILLTFTSFMDKPVFDPNNFGYWGLHLKRNGSIIDSTPPLFYDDNFSYQPVASFIDPTPGDDPLYEIEAYLSSGPGNFLISGGVLNVGLLKR